MNITLLSTTDEKVYRVGATTPTGWEIAEIVSTFFTTTRQDWFAVFDTEGSLRKLINPANVVELDIG